MTLKTKSLRFAEESNKKNYENKILGSGGGEGFPATFCGCAHYNAAGRAGGKSIRTLSHTLINDDLLIDLPADTATVFVTTHITHNQAETHDVIEKIFDGSGIIVAYDGMTLEI